MKLTLLIPTYNEEEIIKSTLIQVLNYLSKQKYSWEVLVVDDGSTDNTPKIVEGFRKKGVRLETLSENKGKGAALKVGVKSAGGEYIIFSDADLSVPIENIERFLHELDKQDVVIGSRRASGAIIEVHQPWLRENMGRVFTYISKIITNTKISDFTCGFKGFAAVVAKDIFERSQVERWSYDAEILYLASKLGYSIKELPVTWKNRKDSRVALAKDIATSLRDLLRVRLNDFFGKYDE